MVREWEWSGSGREWFVSGPRVVHEVRVSQKMGGKDVINVFVCDVIVRVPGASLLGHACVCVCAC